MRFKPLNNTISGIEKGDVYCFEVKSSVEDFRSPNGHNMIGDFNYYVMPEEVFEVVGSEIPLYVGVLAPTQNWEESPQGAGIRSIRKAKRKDRQKPLQEVLLMMFRSAARDRYRLPG